MDRSAKTEVDKLCAFVHKRSQAFEPRTYMEGFQPVIISIHNNELHQQNYMSTRTLLHSSFHSLRSATVLACRRRSVCDMYDGFLFRQTAWGIEILFLGKNIGVPTNKFSSRVAQLVECRYD